MTEQPPDPAPEVTAPADPPAPPEAEPGPEGTEDVTALRREAAGYRRRLRDTEAERDGLRAQVDARDRADAERIAGESLASAGDLWVAGVELSALRGDDGALSPDRVSAAVDQVLAERPHWARAASSVGFDGGARTTPEAAPAHPFGEALKNAGRPA